MNRVLLRTVGRVATRRANGVSRDEAVRQSAASAVVAAVYRHIEIRAIWNEMLHDWRGEFRPLLGRMTLGAA